jgi:hypothetical protein
MKSFIIKHKWTVIYWFIVLFSLFYFTPQQRKYYLDQDIKQFKTQSLLPALIWIFGFIAFSLFIFWLKRTKSLLQSGVGFLKLAAIFAFIIFIFQDIFLGTALFINRQISIGNSQKTYTAHSFSGTELAKNNFILYDLSSKNSIVFDNKLKNEVYYHGLKQNDTIRLQLKKGLWGIVFKSTPFKDE